MVDKIVEYDEMNIGFNVTIRLLPYRPKLTSQILSSLIKIVQ